ncbi:MAG: site-specific integrase [Prevotella sp.]|nr:site-specific integrase [Prevotella sp.]
MTQDRRAYYINTGVSVRAREWKFGRIVNRSDSDELNFRVAIMLKRVDDLVNEYLDHEQDINIEDVRRRVKSPDGRRRLNDADDMIAWMEGQVKMLDVAKGTRKHYKVSVDALAESGAMKRWQDLTVENVHKYDAFLHNMQKHRTDADIKAKKPFEYISQATVRNYHKDIKALLGRALKFGLITANPYDRMRGEIKRGDKETVEFLTDDERDRIEQMTITEGTMLATIRDIFIFQCYTGMAYQDMQAFSLNKCQKDDDRVTYSAQRVKTGITFYIQVLPKALAIAEKYGGSLPKVADQVCNRNLKTIATATGITKKLTTHVGRHTFATWALRRGIPIERVSKMLGHAKITQTQRYAKLLAMDVYSEFDKLQ